MILRERDYIRDGDEIYRRSFAIIRSESDLARFSRRRARRSPDYSCCGMVEIARILCFILVLPSPQASLKNGAPILCDSKWSQTASHAHVFRQGTRYLHAR